MPEHCGRSNYCLIGTVKKAMRNHRLFFDLVLSIKDIEKRFLTHNSQI
jgi:hypothetical protein